MLKWLVRLFLICMLITSLALNVLSLTSTAINTAVSGLVATALGVSTVSGRLKSQLSAVRAENLSLNRKVSRHRIASKKLSGNWHRRMSRMVTYYAINIPLSTIPIAGTGLLLAGTYWEISQLCESYRDMAEFHADIEIEDSFRHDLMRSICPVIEN